LWFTRYYYRSNNLIPPKVATIINIKYRCQIGSKFSDYFIFPSPFFEGCTVEEVYNLLLFLLMDYAMIYCSSSFPSLGLLNGIAVNRWILVISTDEDYSSPQNYCKVLDERWASYRLSEGSMIAESMSVVISQFNSMKLITEPIIESLHKSEILLYLYSTKHHD